MTTAVTRDGSDALKIFTQGSLANLAVLVKLTNGLRAAGLPVPATRREANRLATRSPWIQGQTMRERFATFANLHAAQSDIAAAMTILNRLHQTAAPRVQIPEFNPFRLTDRRLAETSLQSLSIKLRGDALTLRCKLGLVAPANTKVTIIHGDFHAGQMILENHTQEWWMIDLDDVSRGHREADIANFCVNLATRKNQSAFIVREEFEELATYCRLSYASTISSSRFKYYAASALLRRALKFAARGEHEKRVAAILSVGLDLA